MSTPRGKLERAGGEPPSHATFLSTRSFGSLDGLRGLSIIAVLWHHSHDGFPGWPITVRGFLGVDLFFVISGFLIVTLILRERNRTGAISLRGFYVRRILRIFPAYYLLLLIVGITAVLKPGNTSAKILSDLPYAIAYLSNMFPMQSVLLITWSLSTEEQFYMVVPALEKHARRAMPYLLPVAYVAACLPALGLFPSVSLAAFFRETTFGPILLGVMLAHLMDSPRGYALVSRVVGHRFAPAGALVLAVIAASHPAADISGWPRIAIHLSLLLLVAACVVREDHVLRQALLFWPLRRIGITSYGIYLLHMLVWYFVDKGLRRAGIASQVVFFVVESLGSWGAAELSYRYYETRFLALKDRFAPARSAALPVAAQSGASAR